MKIFGTNGKSVPWLLGAALILVVLGALSLQLRTVGGALPSQPTLSAEAALTDTDRPLLPIGSDFKVSPAGPIARAPASVVPKAEADYGEDSSLDIALALAQWDEALNELGYTDQEMPGSEGFHELASGFKARGHLEREANFNRARKRLLADEVPAEPREQALLMLALYSSQTPDLRAGSVFDALRDRAQGAGDPGLHPCQIDELSGQLNHLSQTSVHADSCTPIAQLPPDPTCDLMSKSVNCDPVQDWSVIVAAATQTASVMGRADATDIAQ